MKFFASAHTVPVSETICETWGSIIDQVNKQRLRSSDENENVTGTNDKKTFIKINGPPSGYKNIRKCLKAALTLKYGTNYSLLYTNIHRSKKLGKFVTSEVVNSVNNEAKCLPCFK
ncbi:hypothetical protein AVEN_70719-1 [Araneus ventricosus]|uniref:Uncharacterized protein n=1 Tax=Araneus ventricosus TaxID=182803 RepID=A0A4Y2X814_ARAVE|nr:hypothetical protein AVEN_37257-1 [Araneus ventricosus]GBO45746.1 hypothetical protein AVEN_70719-1 [Araneus ventricosus]